jgi:hypothetical protein
VLGNGAQVVDDEYAGGVTVISLLVNGNWDGVKILGVGEITKKFTLTANAISASAKEKLEKAGGTISIIAGKVEIARNSAKVLAKTSKPAKVKGQPSTPGKKA